MVNQNSSHDYFFRMEDKIQEVTAACKETLKTMISLDRRRESFTDWPLSKDVSSENMARAGWYQVGPLTTRHCVTMKELHGWEGTILLQKFSLIFLSRVLFC